MNKDLVRLFGLLAIASVGACSSVTEQSDPKPEVPKLTCLSNSATMRLPADLRAALPAFGPRMPDDAYVSISQSVPGGFAGVFFEDNHFVLTFVDPATANQARAQIQQAFESRGVGGSGLDVATAELRGARWTFAELDEWYRYIIPSLSGPGSGVSSSDIDEKANTISFGVIDEAARAQLEARLASLGVSCNLVTTVIQPYATIL
jgi:hypothetical protein